MAEVKAIELRPGDKIEGCHFPPSLYAGTVKSTVVVDRGVQINLEPSGYYTVPEDAPIEVIERGGGS